MLFEAQIFALVGAGLLLGAFIIGHRRFPSDFSWLWIAGWFFYLVRFGFDIAITTYGATRSFVMGTNISITTSAVLLLFAVIQLADRDRNYHREGIALWLVLTGWIVAAVTLDLGFSVTYTPLYGAFGLIQLLTAYLFYRYLKGYGYSSTPLIVGSLTMWGLHKFDYPILRPIESIAPYGYIFGAVLAFTTGLGVMLFLVEDAERKAEEGRQIAHRRYEEYQDLFDNLTDPVYIHDFDGNFLNVNDTAVDVLGYSRGRLLSMTPADIVAPEYADEIEDRIEMAGRTDSTTFRSAHVTADGEKVPVEVNAATISYRGEPAILAVVRDISDQVARERRLKEYKRAIEQAGHAVYIADQDRSIKYVNPAFTEITGYSADEVIGESSEILRSGQMPAEYYGKLWETVESGDIWDDIVINERKSGGQYHAQQTVAPIEGDNEAVVGYVGIQTDISDLKEREKQLEVLDRILRHNLKNQMSVILARAELISEESDSRVERAADDIIDTVGKLIEQTDKERKIVTVLTEEPEFTSIPVDSLLRKVRDTVEAEHPGVDVNVDCPGAETVEAIPQFESAVVELVENAIVHNPNERSTVDVEVTRSNGMLQLSISDDGPGIPEDERKILAGEAEIQPLVHGSGLGLWLVKHIVMQSNGTVRFEDSEYGGATVTVVLPEGT
jgi:PAS domain S-box-containing protein